MNGGPFLYKILFLKQERANVRVYKSIEIYDSCLPLTTPLFIVQDFIYLEYKTKLSGSLTHNLYYIQLDKTYFSTIMFLIKDIAPIIDLYPLLKLLFLKICILEGIPDRLFAIFRTRDLFDSFYKERKLQLIEKVFL
jgi:hypothetical protein